MTSAIKYGCFYVFLGVSLLAFFLYVYPRYEYDQKASDIAIGFEQAYTGDISGLFTVTPIQNTGLKGERVVFVYDFSVVPEANLERTLKGRAGEKVIFFERPYPALKPETLASLLDRYGIVAGFLELNPVSNFMRKVLLARSKSGREGTFRVHTIKPAEVTNLRLTYEMVLRRWLRAREERSIDFFWVQPLPSSLEVSYDEYGATLLRLFHTTGSLSPVPVSMNVFFKIMLAIGSFGLIIFYSPVIAIACAVFLSIYGIFNGFADTWLYLAGLTGTFGITGVFREMRKLEFNTSLKYIATIIFALFLGVTVNALSYSHESVTGLLQPHGVKLLTFYLPMLVFIREFISYGLQGLKSRLHWSDFVLVIGLVLAILYSLLRSGNDAFVTNFERQLRDSLEMLLGVRPRFRELIGIPALWLYFRDKHHGFGRYAFIIPVLGVIGLCSIVNAFQHVHTPITIIFLRELLGIVIGTAAGMLIGVFLPAREEGDSV